MINFYHITNNSESIRKNGLYPKDQIDDIPNDSKFIYEVAEVYNMSYPIKRREANFFFPSLSVIPYNYDNKHIVVVNQKDISRDIFVADRDIRDDIIFGNKTDKKAKSYIESVSKVSSDINSYTQNIEGTPEVIIHGHISTNKISEISRGKFIDGDN